MAGPSSESSGASGGSSPACVHCRQGRCLYDESVNPGLDETRHCVHVRELTGKWDDFLDRAEAFNLEEDLALRIWQGREHAPASACPHGHGEFSHAGGLACGFLHFSLCLLALPPCLTPCKRFRPKIENRSQR